MAIQTPGIKRTNLLKQGKESIPVKPTRSYTQIICKSLLFALFLIALPLFPSQAPGFVNQTILPKFWELIHLLFVGIAVSYGLFSRRNVDTEFDYSHSSVDDSQSYMCKIFDVSSSLENGVETPCGFVKKNVYNNSLNSRFVKSESSSDASEVSSLFDEQNGHRTFDFENGSEFESGCKPYNDRNVIQAWNSQYFQRESMIVVAQPNCSMDEYIDHRPLGLPVRSLKSSVKYSQISESSDDGGSGSRSGSSLKASSDSYGGNVNDHFGHMSTNFDHTLMENVAPIPWSSRENIKASPPPPLVEESRYFRSATRTSSMSRSPSRLSTSQSVCSESSNSSSGMDESEKEVGKVSNAVSQSHHYSHGSLTEEDQIETSENDSFDNLDYRPANNLISEEEELEEEDEEEKSFLWSYPSTKQLHTSKIGLHSRHNTYDSLSQYDFKDSSGNRRKESLSRNALGSSSLKLGEKGSMDGRNLPTSTSPTGNGNMRLHARHHSQDSLVENRFEEGDFERFSYRKKDSKPITNTKTSSRGKSVRTFRCERRAKETIESLNEKLGKRFTDSDEDIKEVESVSRGKQERSLEDEKRGRQQEDDDSGFDTESEAEQHEVSSREEGRGSEAGHDESNEVDKKAGEFIAKFREQIRLQKMEKPRMGSVDNYFKCKSTPSRS